MKVYAQGVKYIVVGIISNIILYVFYIVITKIGIGHKTAMTSLYAIGTMQTFFLNKTWTFRNNEKIWDTFLRYIVAYGSAYILNFIALFFFVDLLGFIHEIVQAFAIIFSACILFAIQKWWVFKR